MAAEAAATSQFVKVDTRESEGRDGGDTPTFQPDFFMTAAAVSIFSSSISSFQSFFRAE